MRLALFIAVFAAFIVGSYLIWGDEFETLLAGEDAVAYLRSFGPWAWLVAMVLLMSDVLLPIPATAVLATLGIIYGPVVGGLIGTVGALLAGSVAYLACRAIGERAAVFLLGRESLARGEAFFQERGGWLVAFSRWMIVLPEIVSCLAGLTRMPARQYFLALVCGTVPMCFTYSYIGAAGSQRPFLALALSAVVPVLLWPLAQRWLRRKHRGE